MDNMAGHNYQQNLLENDHLNGIYKIPFSTVKGHQIGSVLHVAGLCFCSVSVLIIYLDCVKYNLHATISIFER